MSLSDAMNRAAQAASNTPSNQIVTQNTVSGAPALSLGTGLDDFLSGGVRPDTWLRVKDTGMWIDRTEKTPVGDEGFTAILDVENLQFFHAVRAEVSKIATYAKSYDGGKTTDKGENFAIAMDDLKNNGEKFSGLYRGADVILILDEPVAQGKTVNEAGLKVGYSTPITGFFPVQSLLKQLANDGRIADAGAGRLALVGAPVRVRVTHTMETNKQNQDYGVLRFELLD